MSKVAVEHGVDEGLERESEVTLDREETKYAIDQTKLAAFLRALATHLSAHRFTGQGANRLPDAQHYTTTVYFDTKTHALFRSALAEPERNAKVRAREYYDLHSSLAELATDPEQIVRYQPWLFLELKRRVGSRTFKHRLKLEKRQIASFLERPAFIQEDSAEGAAAGPDGLAIAAFCAELGEPLEPSCLVHYRRLAFEDASAELRVTLDVEAAFYAPPPDLWQRNRALVRGNFGAPRKTEARCLIEIKQRAASPDWLSHALAQAGARREHFSKFILGSEAVHGHP